MPYKANLKIFIEIYITYLSSLSPFYLLCTVSERTTVLTFFMTGSGDLDELTDLGVLCVALLHQPLGTAKQVGADLIPNLCGELFYLLSSTERDNEELKT